jgi:uncharacterized coiled-coil DUF342 family protein
VNTTVDLGQGAELRVAGSTVGVFLPEAKHRELLAERDALRRELEEARRQLESMRQQAAEHHRQVRVLQAEIDSYGKALTAAVRDQFPVMDDEKALALIAEAEKNGADGAEVLRQIETICRSGPEGGAHAE